MKKYAYVVKKFTFEASHNLPNYPGKCCELHGHRWELWVSLVGPINPVTGMVIDFTDVKTIVNELIISKFDHAHLNNILPNPTAENIAYLISETLEKAFEKLDLELWEVRLAETEGNEVIV